VRLYPALKAVIILSLGIVIGYWLHLDPRLYIAASSLALICAMLFEKYLVGQIALLIAILAGGAGSIAAYHQFSAFDPLDVEISGIISDSPHYSEHITNFPLDNATISTINGSKIKTDHLIWVNVRSRAENLTEGSHLTLRGGLELFESKRNPSDFNYKRWRKYNNYLGLVWVNDPVDIEITGKSNSLIVILRSALERKIVQYSGKDAPLIRALILGIRRDIDPALTYSLQQTGLAHLLALSGLHIGFVVLIIAGLAVAFNIPIPWRYLLVICGILIYALILPPRPSTIRAVIVAISLMAGPVLKKWSPPLNSLGFAALLILTFRPGDIFDVGFQLSFAAVAGIVMFTNMISITSQYMRDLNSSYARKIFRTIVHPMFISVSVMLMIYPLMSIHFGIIPALTVMYNLIAIPLTGLLFLNSWIAVITSFFWSGLASIFGNSLSLTVLLWKGFAALASQNNIIFSIHFKPLAVLALISTTIWLGSKRSRFAHSILLYLLASVVIILWQNLSLRQNAARIWFVDVGQGDGSIITLPYGSIFIVDAGQKKSTAVHDMLTYLDCKKVDLLVASHSDADHIGGMIEIINDFQVEMAIISPKNSDTKTYQELMETSRLNDVHWEKSYAGDKLRLKGNSCSLTILNPPADAGHWSTNNSSLTMWLAVALTKGDSAIFLTTGDIEGIAETWLVENSMNVKADLLKIPHHGSATSSSLEFIDAVQPEVAVISRGKTYESRNKRTLNKITDRYSAAGIKYYITSESGAVLFESSRGRGSTKWENIDWRNPTFVQWLSGYYR